VVRARCRLPTAVEAYRDRALALAAADIIRSWADEEPRALWERLRAEGPPVCPPADAREVARWGVLGQWSYRRGQPESGFNSGAVAVRPATATEHGSNGRNAGDEARLWRALPTLPATITPDARTVDPREVARWLASAAMSMRAEPSAGFAVGDGCNTVWAGGSPQTSTAMRLSAAPTLPATIADDARPIEPGTLPPGTVAYMDPPYLNTTGYAADLGRAEVVALARRWAEAGAVVCISEAEPIPELVADGWHAVEITGARVGQKRTFSKQQAEWLTLNRPPAWTVPVQTGLFG
jgi:hypothetical protein